MREIESVADDLDVGTILEGVFIHFTPIRDAHFGEAGATSESPFPNLLHRFWDGDTREAGATIESSYSNLRHRWRDGDAREAGATIESTLSNLLYPLG